LPFESLLGDAETFALGALELADKVHQLVVLLLQAVKPLHYFEVGVEELFARNVGRLGSFSIAEAGG
jgi:hypothetical protein